MAFKRAQWHSGLTYIQECTHCHTKFKYTDYSLDFRPWYADGFVYCPKCKSPCRHHENYAVNEDGTYVYGGVTPVQSQPQNPAPAAASDGSVAYCNKCGRQYRPGEDFFCSGCGNKLS